MYMSVEDQYVYEFILVISIGIVFAFWYIKNRIDYKMKKQYQLGFYQGYDKGWYACRDIMQNKLNKKK